MLFTNSQHIANLNHTNMSLEEEVARLQSEVSKVR